MENNLITLRGKLGIEHLYERRIFIKQTLPIILNEITLNAEDLPTNESDLNLIKLETFFNEIDDKNIVLKSSYKHLNTYIST